ncbi:MAG TPA: DUF6167 family protein [Pedococcus sp.]|jgi:hypothetical protein|nr:DUF6167 family protein [Pedococcus sp.]
MSRLFWAALGAAAGVYAVRKVSKAAEAYTPAGVAHGLSDFGEGLRELAAAVREGMDEREGELRLALGIDTETSDSAHPGDSALDRGAAGRLDAATARALLDDPTGPRPSGSHRAR